MAIEKIWKNITVLEDKSYTSTSLGVSLYFLALAFLPMLVIISGSVGFNIDRFNGSTLVLMSVTFIIPAFIFLIIYLHRPKKIELHISIDTHYISIEELKKYFKLSKVSYDKHFVACNIKPKRKYCNDVIELLLKEVD